MDLPRDAESIRIVLEQAAAAAFQRAQAGMENMNVQDAQNVRRLLEHAASEAIARAHEFEIPMTAFHRPAEAVEGAFMGLWPILKRILIVYTIGLSILLSSVGMYGIFYMGIQPGKAACEQLFFDYSGTARHPAPPIHGRNDIDCEVEDSCPNPLTTEEYREPPWAAVDFFSKHSLWEAYHDDVIPKPLTDTRVLQENKNYFFEIILELPESPLNRRTGMFMVHVELQASNGTKLASSLRPARLPHETHWISTIRKSLWIVPMMIGAAQETRSIVVPAFRHFKESSALPLRYATVSLVMQVKDKPRREEPLEVTRGEIRIGKELTDFQFLLREYFLTCYVVGVILLSTMQVVGLLFLRSYWKHRQRQNIIQQMREDNNEDPSETLELDESQLEAEANNWEDLPQTQQTNTETREETIPVVDDNNATDGTAPVPITPEENLSTPESDHLISNTDATHIDSVPTGSS